MNQRSFARTEYALKKKRRRRELFLADMVRSSTRNQDKTRDPDMHQTKKGNQWHFGMNALFGLANLVIAKKSLMAIHARAAP